MAIQQSFVAANHVLDDTDALAAQLEEHGYLYFQDILAHEPILKARREILELCREAGWLDPNADLMDGVWNGSGAWVEGEPEYMSVYKQVLDLPSFLALPHDRALLDVNERLLGGEVLVHPRKIGRITFPNNEDQATPPHQDFAHIKGSPRTYSTWHPLGDCPRSLGGLAFLTGSHRTGFQEHVAMQGTGGKGIVTQDDDERWHSGDLQLGDCLLFHSHTIHKALPNRTGKYLRISVDNRYQLASDDIDPSSLRPHFAPAE